MHEFSMKSVSCAALVMALALPLAACKPGSATQPSIIVILVDTLRADYLGSFGFSGEISPHLDRLADESVLFLNCYAPSPWTKPSVASLFTSLYAQAHGLTNHEGQFWGGASPRHRTGILPDKAHTMAEALSDRGYATAAFISNPWVISSYGFAQGFDVYDERNVGLAVPADRLTRDAEKWLDSLARDQPYFLYLHFMDVHAPYAYHSPRSDFEALAPGLDAGQERLLTEAEVPYNRWQNIEERPDWATDEMRHTLSYWRTRYASGVRTFDRRLASFVEYLRQSDRLDDGYFVVTSDHGEELFEHGDWSHGWELFDEQIHIPLMVRAPRGKGGGRRVNEIVELIDLMPTFLSIAGSSGEAQSTGTMQGRDISPLLHGDDTMEPHFAFATATQKRPALFAVRGPRYKLLMDVDSGHSRLYDLIADPGEHNGEINGESELLRQLQDELLAHIERSLAHGALDPETSPIPEDLQDRLKALGYLN